MDIDDGLGDEHLGNMETLVKTDSGVQCDLEETYYHGGVVWQQ